MKGLFAGGSDRISVGPLFDLPDDGVSFEDACYQGSRIGMEHFDEAPRVTEVPQYRFDRQNVRIC